MLAFLLLLACFHFHLNDAESISRQKRVVGGDFSSENDFPYIVSLKVYRFETYIHFCAGAIVNEKFIMSSAHCVLLHDAAKNSCFKGKFVQSLNYHVVAVVGTNKLNKNGHSYDIANYMYHSEFDYNWGTNDISLLQTTESISFNRKVQPISIYTGKIPAGSSVMVAGWGLTSFPGKPSNYLKYINSNTISYKECAAYWKNVYANQICTLTTRGGVCISDSGGPLVYKNKLAGLVSFGRPCAVGYPDVFTNVSHLIEWIEYNILCISESNLSRTTVM